MGFFKQLWSTVRDMSSTPEIYQGGAEEVDPGNLPCRAPNMTDQLTPGGGDREAPAVVRQRIMDLRGVTDREVVVDAALCTRCGTCAPLCPDGAITVDDEGKTVDAALCTTCGCCVSTCPVDAISIEEQPLDPH